MKTKTYFLLLVILMVLSALGCSHESIREVATVSIPDTAVHTHSQQDDTHQLSSLDTETNLCAQGHDWGCWRTVRKATMEMVGLSKRSCYSCGASQQRELEKIPSTHEHIYVCSISIVPTCTSDGLLVYVCNCGSSITEEIPMSEHLLYPGNVCACEGGYTSA